MKTLMDKSHTPVAKIASTRPTYSKAKDIAKKIGLCPKTISRWSEKGLVKKYKISQRLCLYDEQDVYDYIEAGCVSLGEVES